MRRGLNSFKLLKKFVILSVLILFLLCFDVLRQNDVKIGTIGRNVSCKHNRKLVLCYFFVHTNEEEQLLKQILA